MGNQVGQQSIIMFLHEIETPFDFAKKKLKARFTELGIEDAVPYFVGWMYWGQFKLSYDELDKYEAAFYLIRSVLPNKVLNSYSNLGPLYRGMTFSYSQLRNINSEGLPISSRIMSWTPDFWQAEQYLDFYGVILRHTPIKREVLISLNKETMDFLKIDSVLIVNKGETILTLPVLDVRDMIYAKVVQGRLSYVQNPKQIDI